MTASGDPRKNGLSVYRLSLALLTLQWLTKWNSSNNLLHQFSAAALVLEIRAQTAHRKLLFSKFR